MDEGAINGILIAVFILAVLIAPIFCCQVSDEEYNSIV